MNRLPILALLLACAPGVHALDWGVNLAELPVMVTGEQSLAYSASEVHLWLTAPLSGMAFRLETVGTWAASTADLTVANQNLNSQITLDVEELSLAGHGVWNGGEGGAFDWSLGRRQVTDLTGGWIVDSRWDGAAVTAHAGQTKLALGAGYSGLLLNANSRVDGSPADLADQSNTSLLLAPKRLLGYLGVGVNEAFFRQDLQLELLGDYDFRDADEAVHGAYATAAFSGPLPGGLSERLYTTGAVRRSSTEWTLGLLSGAEVGVDVGFLGFRAVLSAVAAWAQGTYGFQPVSGDSVSDVISLPTAHAASVKLDGSIRPWTGFVAGVRADSLWRTSTDLPPLAGILPGATDSWLGTEAGVYGSWEPTSDVSLGWSGGVFFPQFGAFASTTQVTALSAISLTVKL